MTDPGDEVTSVMRTGCGGRSQLPRVLAGRYQIGEVLGEGGMGVVCRGFDLDLEETVAIKFLRAELAEDEALRARFRQEVKLARRVTHPSVARVFEFGRDGATCFLTMEFVEGESLQALLRREAPLGPERALALGIGLCEGLAAAHAAGVVHGDIKPGNVLVGPRRGAVLTDFGIAQVLSERGCSEGTSGTPLYMAPEQARGEPMVAATDVYALGVVLCEMLTGRAPWPAIDAMGLILQRRAGKEPDLSRMAPRLSAEWAGLIAECLRASPRRPADARALLARLTALRGAAGVGGRASVEAAPLASGAGPRWITVAPLEAPRSLAWLTADMLAALARTRWLRVAAGTPPSEMTLAGRVEGEARELTDGVSVSLRVLTGDGAVRARFEILQTKRALHVLGGELAQRVMQAIDPSLVLPPSEGELSADVSDLYVRGRQAYATLNFEQACELFAAGLRRAPGNRVLDLGLTLARVQRLTTFRDEGETELAELRARIEAAVAEHGEQGETHLALARIALSLGDTPGSARSALAAISRAPSLGEAHGLLADILIDIGRLPDAERRLDLAVALDRGSLFAWVTRTRLWAYQGRWDEFDAGVREVGLHNMASPVYVRLLLWRGDCEGLARAAEALVDDRSPFPPRMRWVGRRMVDFGLGLGDRRAIVEELRAVLAPTSSARRNALFGQLFVELLCQLGELTRAMELLRATTEEDALIDWQWIEHCPVLAPLRGEPGFAALRECLRTRADAVAEAIWGAG